MSNEKISRSKLSVVRDYKINDEINGKEEFFSPKQVYKPEDSDGTLYWHVLDKLDIIDNEPTYNMITVNESYVKDWNSLPDEIKENYKGFALIKTFDYEPSRQEIEELIPLQFRQ